MNSKGNKISIHCLHNNHQTKSPSHSSQKHQSYSSKIVMIMASVRIPRRSSSIRVINEAWEKAGRPKHHFSSPRAELILDKNHPFSLSHSASWLDRDDKNMFKCNYHVCKSSHWSIKFNWVLPDIRKGHLNCFFYLFSVATAEMVMDFKCLIVPSSSLDIFSLLNHDGEEWWLRWWY